ncbi:NrsF family protein [Variovorax sp. VNK109]|uniref:NrsF family protein n=1 Tax=Variovorax sp. VNK109 TaxID=3400919 RepID=UPI003BFEE8FE
MKTDRLIDLLASDAAPVARNVASRRMGLALLLGLPLAALIVATEYGFRDDLMQVAAQPMFWVKLGLPLVVAIAGFVVATRLGRPGVRAGLPVAGLLLPLAFAWGLGLFAWFDAPAAERASLLWGQTWRSCAFSIGLIAFPAFAAALAALRSLAPTKPVAAGAAAGAFAGGLGAAVYALHCPELAAPFIAVWYVLGVALPVVAGAVAGRFLLKW